MYMFGLKRYPDALTARPLPGMRPNVRHPQQQEQPRPSLGPPEHLHQLGVTSQQCPGMRAMASARLRHPLYKMLKGRLGMSLTAVPDQDRNEPPENFPSTSDDVLCFASDGSVVSVSAGDRSSDRAQALLQLQGCIQNLPPAELAGLSGVLWPYRQPADNDNRHAPRWELALAGSNNGSFEALGMQETFEAPGGAVDGALLAMVSGTT